MTLCPVLVLGHWEACCDLADQLVTGLDPAQVAIVNTEPGTGHQAAVHSGVS